MKKLLLLTLLSPIVTFAQDKHKYDPVVGKFVKYFNMRQSDSICALLFDERTTGLRCAFRDAATDGSYEMHGKIKSFEYIGEEGEGDRRLTMYKVVTSKKGNMVLSFHMEENHKLSIFLLEPMSK